MCGIIHPKLTNFIYIFIIIHTSRLVSSTHELVEYVIDEEIQRNAQVGNLKGSLGLSPGQYMFLMQAKDPEISKLFQVDKNSGEITVIANKIDREMLCDDYEFCCKPKVDCKLFFKVRYSLNSNDVSKTKWSQCSVEVKVNDINDIVPRFSQAHYTIEVSENTKPGKRFPLPEATDNDSFKNSIKYYRGEGSGNYFNIISVPKNNDYPRPMLEVSQTLDRETTSRYEMKVFAIDGGNPEKTGTLSLTIEIMDENDNTPVIAPITIIELKENTRVGDTIYQIKAYDKDKENTINSQLTYKIAPEASKLTRKLYNINEQTGVISLESKLDYDEDPNVNFGIPIIVHDNGNPKRTASASLPIRVFDMNDERPKIEISQVDYILENMPMGDYVATVWVTDEDAGSNGKVSCSIDNEHFRLEEIRYQTRPKVTEFTIKTNRPLDRETRHIESITMNCQDHGDPPLSADPVTRQITVEDVNDNSPVFLNQPIKIYVKENLPPGSYITKLNATDKDELDSATSGIQYFIDKTAEFYLRIDRKTGKLYTRTTIDRETINGINFQATITDAGDPPKKSSTNVELIVEDENDNAPEFQRSNFVFKVDENKKPDELIAKIIAEDKDSQDNQKITYRILDHKREVITNFNLNKDTGELTIKRQLDREQKDSYNFSVVAADNGSPPKYTTAQVTIMVEDVNDNPPKFIYPTKANHSASTSVYNPRDTVIAKVTAMDPDAGPNAELTYAITNGNRDGIFRIEPRTGIIKIARDLEKSHEGEYRLEIMVTDSGSQPLSSTSSITIILDKSAPQIGYRDGNKGGIGNDYTSFSSDKNLILVICLVITATILAIIFMLIILYIKRRPPGSLTSSGQTDRGLPIKKDIHHLGNVASNGSLRGPDSTPVKSIIPGKEMYSTLKVGASTISRPDKLDERAPLTICQSGKSNSRDELNDLQKSTLNMNSTMIVPDGNINYYHQINCASEDYNHPASLFYTEHVPFTQMLMADSKQSGYQTLYPASRPSNYSTGRKLTYSSNSKPNNASKCGTDNRVLISDDNSDSYTTTTSAKTSLEGNTMPEEKLSLLSKDRSQFGGDKNLFLSGSNTFVHGSKSESNYMNVKTATAEVIDSDGKVKRKPYTLVASSFV